MTFKVSRALSRACFIMLAAASSLAIAGPKEDLLAAASEGQLPKAERALKKVTKPDVRGEKNATPLMLAAERGHIDIVRALLRAGADVNAKRDGGFAAIHLASARGKLDVVKELMVAGASASAANDSGFTPILAAGMSGNFELIRLLADSGADKAATDTNGLTLLMTSARGGCVECMEFARTPQSDFKAPNSRGVNMLDYALASRKWPAVKYVLDAGGTLTDAAKKRVLFDLIAELGDQLLKAPLTDVQIMRAAIAAGAELEVTDEDGMTPLLRAIKVAHVEAVEVLVGAKANVAAVDKEGNGVFALAARRDVMESAQMLLAISEGSGSADTMRKAFKPAERSDVSPATARRLAMASLLLAAGADSNVKGRGGNSALHDAVSIGDVEMVQLLLGAGANVNAINDDQATPLLRASSWGFDAPVQALLAAGADTKLANKNGKTALSVARDNNNAKVIAMLEAAGAK